MRTHVLLPTPRTPNRKKLLSGTAKSLVYTMSTKIAEK